MPTTTLWARFDGSTDVNTLSSPISWNSRFIGYYSQYESNPANDFVANLRLTGSNWTVSSLRIGAESRDTQLNLSDLNDNAGRRIDYLQLGYNSDVDLISTRVRYIVGYDGDLHDVSLGSATTNSVDLSAARNLVTTGTGYVANIDISNGGIGIIEVNGDVGRIDTDEANDRLTVNEGYVAAVNLGSGNNRVVMHGDARIESFTSFGGDNLVVLNDSARMEQLRLGSGDNIIRILDGDTRIRHIKLTEGDNTIVTTGWLESFVSWQSSNTMTIGSGGAGSMQFQAETLQSHVINATGYISNLNAWDSGSTSADDQTTRLTFTEGAGAGSIILGSGNDRVTTDGYVDLLHTGRGNDIVNVGTGGMGLLVLHEGDDLARVQNFDNPEFGVMIHGRSGIDTIDFSRISGVGVSFDLTLAGQYQNIGAPGGDLLADPVVGYVAEAGVENLVGTLRRDLFVGDQNANDLNGRGGLDTIHGGGGDDILRGQNGADELDGGEGRDMIFGGIGSDTITGGADNDNLAGQEDADIFVFGADSGFDQVRDFEDGSDILQIADHAGGFGTLVIGDRGSNLRVDHDGGSILLIGLAGTTLTGADFDFV